jgi:hypothetical protein
MMVLAHTYSRDKDNNRICTPNIKIPAKATITASFENGPPWPIGHGRIAPWTGNITTPRFETFHTPAKSRHPTRWTVSFSVEVNQGQIRYEGAETHITCVIFVAGVRKDVNSTTVRGQYSNITCSATGIPIQI